MEYKKRKTGGNRSGMSGRGAEIRGDDEERRGDERRTEFKEGGYLMRSSGGSGAKTDEELRFNQEEADVPAAPQLLHPRLQASSSGVNRRKLGLTGRVIRLNLGASTRLTHVSHG